MSPHAPHVNPGGAVNDALGIDEAGAHPLPMPERTGPVPLSQCIDEVRELLEAMRKKDQ